MKSVQVLRANLILSFFALFAALSAIHAVFEYRHPVLIESSTYVPLRASNGSELVIKTD